MIRTQARRHEGTEARRGGRSSRAFRGVSVSERIAAVPAIAIMRRTIGHLVALATVLLAVHAARADDSILFSKHDLSMFGPGPVRSLEESEVCIFCHTPHNASPAAPVIPAHTTAPGQWDCACPMEASSRYASAAASMTRANQTNPPK